MNDPSTLVMTETLSILLIMAGLCILPMIMIGGLALLHRWERAPQKRSADTMRDLNSLQARIAAVEAGQNELSVVQERLDFLEAVLEAGSPQAQLPGAGDAGGERPASR